MTKNEEIAFILLEAAELLKDDKNLKCMILLKKQ